MLILMGAVQTNFKLTHQLSLMSLFLKEKAIQEVIDGCANPVSVFLPNYPLNKQQLDIVTSEVGT